MSGNDKYLIDRTKVPHSVYVLLTMECNLRCPHCYLEAGPERKESMPMELRKKVIDEVAKNGVSKIEFSGGEPTVEMDKLVDTIRYAKETYDRTGYPKDVALQTNAYFLRNLEESEIEKKLEYLKSEGLTQVDIASFDRYHDFGIKKKIRVLAKIKTVADGVFGEENVTYRGATEPLVPIGRVKKSIALRPKWSVGPNSDFWTKDSNMYQSLTIDVNGDVHPCFWQPKSMGKLPDEPLADILERARRPDSIFRKLAEKNGFAKLDPEGDLGISREKFDSLIGELGECGGCHEYFRSKKNDV